MKLENRKQQRDREWNRHGNNIHKLTKGQLYGSREKEEFRGVGIRTDVE